MFSNKDGVSGLYRLAASKLTAVILAALLVFWPLAVLAEIPAFPGAEGYGSTTAGGRGGRHFVITTLAASGPGSLREALEFDGPRIVTFAVGGVIDLGGESIVVRSPYLTVAGQTAPANGIAIKNAGLVLATHDIIIRGMRFRIGDLPEGSNPRYRDALQITDLSCDTDPQSCTNPPYRIILDHNSISWAIDENVSIWNGAHDITMSWNMISEGLNCSLHNNGCHSMGLLLGPESKRISLHHNLFAHNGERNPLIYNGNSVELINNLIYDWTVAATIAGGCAYDAPDGARVNAIGNHYIPGPSTYAYTDDSHTVDRSILISTCWDTSQVFLQDNLGVRLDHEGAVSDWTLAKNETYDSIRSDVPVLAPSGIETTPVEQVATRVLEGAGALAPSRDLTDQRVVAQVRAKSGSLIDSQYDVEGWDQYAEATLNVQDTDQDGLPDLWEQQNNLNAADPADAMLIDEATGYAHLETYINHLMFNPRSTEGLTDGDASGNLNDGQIDPSGGVFGWLMAGLMSFWAWIRSLAPD